MMSSTAAAVADAQVSRNMYSWSTGGWRLPAELEQLALTLTACTCAQAVSSIGRAASHPSATGQAAEEGKVKGIPRCPIGNCGGDECLARATDPKHYRCIHSCARAAADDDEQAALTNEFEETCRRCRGCIEYSPISDSDEFEEYNKQYDIRAAAGCLTPEDHARDRQARWGPDPVRMNWERFNPNASIPGYYQD